MVFIDQHKFSQVVRVSRRIVGRVSQGLVQGVADPTMLTLP